MNKIMAALLACVFLMATQAYAADPACEAKAAEKKLAGAAKTSFMKKCEKDAAAAGPAAACEAKAGEKNLHGAAKNSFVKKCVTAAAPAPAK
jgi:hypothetical protein